ncbi:hypothetical protein SAMN05421770_102165 [Granulicella rosea]|uniref:Uncharacterized protein n=1 Tax=Granulicella rosea TaxID=474952 RepID=A0A239H0N6_9BACT|nr:hypothetical protein [Granulicella rosea]SNS74742.1 hypothetical protein SAMN05421770_102165 [Granulicella rosea]
MRAFLSPLAAAVLLVLLSVANTPGNAQRTAPPAAPVAQEQEKPADAAPVTAPPADAAAAPAAVKPPVLGPDGKPLPALTPVKGGKPEKKKKEKPPKLYPVTITRGILTVDGWTSRAALNYDIPDFKFLYISVPGMGTTVVSNAPFPGGKEQADAFKDSSIIVKVDGHVLELASDNRLMGKKPLPAWVLLDTTYTYPSTYPTVGYGYDVHAPYLWPGSKPNVAAKGIAATAPPLPKNLRPVDLAKPCLPIKPGPGPAPPNPKGLPPCVAPPKPIAPVSATPVAAVSAPAPAVEAPPAAPAPEPAPAAAPAAAPESAK